MNISKRNTLKLLATWVLVSGVGLAGLFAWSLFLPHIAALHWPSNNPFWLVFAGRVFGTLTFVLSGSLVGLLLSRRLSLMLKPRGNVRV